MVQRQKVTHKNGNASGITQLEVLDLHPPTNRLTAKPFHLPLHDTHKIGGIGTAIVPQIETVILKPGMATTFAADNVTSEVKTTEMYHEVVTETLPEFNMLFNVKNMSLWW